MLLPKNLFGKILFFCYRYHKTKKIVSVLLAAHAKRFSVSCVRICLFYLESPHPPGGRAANDAECNQFLKGEAIAAKDLAETGHEVEYFDPCPDDNIDDFISKGDCDECPWMKKHCASTCLCIEESKDLFCTKKN